MQAEPPPPPYPGYPTPNTNCLSELTLLSPSPLFSWSKSRDIAVHSYTSEPSLFYLAVLTANPSPIKIRMTKGDSRNGDLLGTCEPAESPGEKPGAWKINVDNKRGGGKVKGQLKTRMEKLGGGRYRWTLPRIDPERVSSVEDEETVYWTHTPQDKTERKESSFANPDWKLQNLATGEVHAVFVERWSTKERGGVQFRRSFGRDWELAVLLAVGVVVEEERRAKRRRDGGGFTRGFLLRYA